MGHRPVSRGALRRAAGDEARWISLGAIKKASRHPSDWPLHICTGSTSSCQKVLARSVAMSPVSAASSAATLLAAPSALCFGAPLPPSLSPHLIRPARARAIINIISALYLSFHSSGLFSSPPDCLTPTLPSSLCASLLIAEN